MIRAVYKDGQIKPVDPLPEHWREGRELLIEEGEPSNNPRDLERWLCECDEAQAQVSPEEWERFHRAIDEHRREAKAYMRREMGLD